MRTESNAIRGETIVVPHLDLDALKERSSTVFSKDSLVTLAILGSTLTALGLLVSAVYGAIQTDTIAGFSPYLSSFNWQLSIPAY